MSHGKATRVRPIPLGQYPAMYPTGKRHTCGHLIWVVVKWWDKPVRYCPYWRCGYFEGTPTEFPDVLLEYFSGRKNVAKATAFNRNHETLIRVIERSDISTC